MKGLQARCLKVQRGQRSSVQDGERGYCMRPATGKVKVKGRSAINKPYSKTPACCGLSSESIRCGVVQ